MKCVSGSDNDIRHSLFQTLFEQCLRPISSLNAEINTAWQICYILFQSHLENPIIIYYGRMQMKANQANNSSSHNCTGRVHVDCDGNITGIKLSICPQHNIDRHAVNTNTGIELPLLPFPTIIASDTLVTHDGITAAHSPTNHQIVSTAPRDSAPSSIGRDLRGYESPGDDWILTLIATWACDSNCHRDSQCSSWRTDIWPDTSVTPEGGGDWLNLPKSIIGLKGNRWSTPLSRRRDFVLSWFGFYFYHICSK
jgi:hypothetical protein